MKIVESWLYIAALPARVNLNPASQNITDKNVPKNAIMVGIPAKNINQDDKDEDRKFRPYGVRVDIIDKDKNE